MHTNARLNAEIASAHKMDVLFSLVIRRLNLSLLNSCNGILTGNEAHYSILKQIQFVHLDDLCIAHIFLFEHPEANGRYICSSHDVTIYELARMMKERYPQYSIPQK